MKLCANCRFKPARRGGKECNACARYRQRHGVPRSEAMAYKRAVEVWHDHQERQLLRRMAGLEK